MSNTREAKKILKAYGKAMYKERIRYVDSFAMEKTPLIHRISYRHMMKRCMLVVLILILTFSILVIGANALGLKFLNLSFLEFKDHTEVTVEKGAEKTEGETKFYMPGYVPEGYELIAKDMFLDKELSYVYENAEGIYLYIDQNISDSFSAKINNEDCEITTETIGDMEARFYRYYDRSGGGIQCLVRKGDILIDVYGLLKDKEIRKIILNLK